MIEGDDAQELAERCAALMWSGDLASKSLGMEIEEIAPGRAVVSMVVRDDMVNGWDLCHGGLMASLADTAFALACNTHGTVTVASGFDLDILEPGGVGDRLVATAVERVRRNRSGLCDVTVRSGETVVAEFRGRSRSLGKKIDLEG